MNTQELQKLSHLQKNKILISAIFGIFGSSIFSFALSLALLEETKSAVIFSGSLAIAPILAVLTMPILGSMADKYNRKKMVLFAQALATISMLLFALFYITDSIPKLYLFYGITLLQRLADLIYGAAYRASLGQLVSKEELLSLNAGLATIEASVALVSLAIGSILYQIFPFFAFIIFEIVTEIVPFLLTVTLDFKAFENPTEPRTTKEDSLFTLLKEGFQYIYKNTSLLYLNIHLLLFTFCSSSVLVGFPLIIIHSFQMQSVELGILQIAFTVGSIFVGMYLSRKKAFPYPFLKIQRFSTLKFLMTFIWAALIAFRIGYIETLICIGIANFTIGACNGMLLTPVNTWILSNTPQNLHGRIFTVKAAISQALAPIGILLFGFLFDYFRTDFVIVAFGGLAILCFYLLPHVFKLNLKEIKE